MKGTLLKSEQGWIVTCLAEQSGDNTWVNTFPLHPDNVKRFEALESLVKRLEEFGQVFDNIDARIEAYPEVEFEIVEQYAKLK
jgi:hypothetical protein